jgi:hypothetical protein
MNSMKPIPPPLPDVVSRYFDAANRFDAASAADCFTPEATVLDEGNTYVGTETIKNWITHTGEKFRPNTSVVDAQRKGEEIAVSARVSGNFPGSPVELRFVFALSQEKIARLSIQ